MKVDIYRLLQWSILESFFLSLVNEHNLNSILSPVETIFAVQSCVTLCLSSFHHCPVLFSCINVLSALKFTKQGSNYFKFVFFFRNITDYYFFSNHNALYTASSAPKIHFTAKKNIIYMNGNNETVGYFSCIGAWY